jgi:phage tail tube protein FII
MAGFIDINGSIISDSVYSNGELVARDVAITLPPITPQSAEASAMGKMNVPIPGQYENLELSITKIGVDLGLIKMCTPGAKNLEFRWVANTIKADGTTTPSGFKAFIRGTAKTFPGIGITPGEAGENEATFDVSRYQVFQDGKELLLFDRLAGIVKFNGKDYAADYNKYL